MKPTENTFAAAGVSLLTLRANPDHKSELLTQILFGESFRIISNWQDWLFVKHSATGIEGWLFNRAVLPVGDESRVPDFEYTNLQTVYVRVKKDNSHPIAVLPGSSLPDPPEMGASFDIGKITFLIEPPLPEKIEINEENRMEALAQIFINAPFLHGGRSLYGIDDAGLAQLVYKMYGLWVPGDLNELVKLGKTIAFAHDAQPGDIAFFENAEGAIIHCGIITQPGKIIHCHGVVREDPLDHAGIYGIHEEDYLYYLRIIRRILPD